jgi:alpha-1,3-glucosyltransferase
MAITYELPLSKWYFEKTSVWTLDYPPFFAYFEWLLARPAAFFDREMVRVQNLYYDSLTVIVYQRATVILSDLMFLYGCIRYFQADAAQTRGKFDLLRFLFNYGSVALLILDGIHFQYNSMMYGLMILSIAFIKEKSYFKSALTYAILLNFKHIYLYFAPCFGLLYLKKVVFKSGSISKGILNFIFLGIQTVLVFALSFGPFLYIGGLDQLAQIASRLFPF